MEAVVGIDKARPSVIVNPSWIPEHPWVVVVKHRSRWTDCEREEIERRSFAI